MNPPTPRKFSHYHSRVAHSSNYATSCQVAHNTGDATTTAHLVIKQHTSSVVLLENSSRCQTAASALLRGVFLCRILTPIALVLVFSSEIFAQHPCKDHAHKRDRADYRDCSNFPLLLPTAISSCHLTHLLFSVSSGRDFSAGLSACRMDGSTGNIR